MVTSPRADQSLRVAIFVSGGGTNLQTLIDAAKMGDLGSAKLIKVIASRPGIKAIERAQLAELPVEIIRKNDFADQNAYDQALIHSLKACDIDLIVLAGFLTRLGSRFIAAYKDRIINIHPSLLPEFGGSGFYGLKPHEAVLQAGREVTGATVHLVDETYDTGRILLQKKVKVMPEDTPETLQKRVMREAEQELLPEAVRQIAAGKLLPEITRV
ncbi:MAG: phosphoribosylglycinamide formyltransferase [Clostridiaceae bacterium]|nr:phosphoribosylglycinamide formyltransferase [Clostridiaceae bacterium]